MVEQDPIDKIDKIFYINLDRRTDRNRDMINELKRMGIREEKVERFSAIPSNPGSVGCGMSHLQVLQMAQHRNYETVLLLEDDFTFLTTKEELRQSLNYLFNDFHQSWDVVMLGYNLLEASECHDPILACVKKARVADAYLVHRHYYQTLITNLEIGNQLLQRTGQHWLYCNDVCWQSLQRIDKWFYFKKQIGKQRPSISDTGYDGQIILANYDH